MSLRKIWKILPQNAFLSSDDSYPRSVTVYNSTVTAIAVRAARGYRQRTTVTCGQQLTVGVARRTIRATRGLGGRERHQNEPAYPISQARRSTCDDRYRSSGRGELQRPGPAAADGWYVYNYRPSHSRPCTHTRQHGALDREKYESYAMADNSFPGRFIVVSVYKNVFQKDLPMSSLCTRRT